MIAIAITTLICFTLIALSVLNNTHKGDKK